MCFVTVNFQESYPVQAVMYLKECQKSWREEGEEQGGREGREDASNCAIPGAVNVTIPLTLTTFIWCVYRFLPCDMKAIHAGVGLGLGPR